MLSTRIVFANLFCTLLLLNITSTVHAQSDTDPANPAAVAPAIRYQSAFTGYQSYSEEKIASWRAVNDRVTIVGGHVGALRNNNDATTQPLPPAAPQHMHQHGDTNKE